MPRVETIVPAAEANESAKADLYGGAVLRLPASELLSRTNARPGDAPADEPKRIEALAASMRATGQIMPLVVDRGGADEWFVVAGRGDWRRRALSTRTYMLDCIVRNEGTDALQVAIHENTRRRGYNALQYAHLIAAVRAEKHFTGTKEIAAYMGCSRAQIKQHERLLAKPEGMGDAVYESLLADLTGRNTRADAVFFALTHVEPKQAGKVMERAAEIAQAETVQKPSRKQKSAYLRPNWHRRRHGARNRSNRHLRARPNRPKHLQKLLLSKNGTWNAPQRKRRLSKITHRKLGVAPPISPGRRHAHVTGPA